MIKQNFHKLRLLLYLYTAYLSFILVLVFHNAAIMNEKIEIQALTMNEIIEQHVQLALIFIVLILQLFSNAIFIFLSRSFLSKRKLTFDKLYLWNATIFNICVTLSFDFRIRYNCSGKCQAGMPLGQITVAAGFMSVDWVTDEVYG